MSQNSDSQNSDCQNSDSQSRDPAFDDEPWNDLATIAEVESWVAIYDQRLQEIAGKSSFSRYGVCFQFAVGGSMTLHTTGEGDIIVELDRDAMWVVPVITAATGRKNNTAPVTQMLALPGDVMTQLILGLNSLISSSRLVANHRSGTHRLF